MVSKFLYIPLAIIALVAIVNVLGLTAGSSFPMTVSLAGNEGTIYYDSGGNEVCYANLTVITGVHQLNAYPRWVDLFDTHQLGIDNSSSMVDPNWSAIVYPLYFDTAASAPVPFSSEVVYSGASTHFDLGSSLGLIAVTTILMGVGAVIGMHFFGSGESDVSIGMVLKFTGFLMIWGVFSILSMNTLTLLPLALGGTFYFGLTLIYVIGMVDSIGHPSGD